MTPGSLCQIEIPVSDLQVALRFYEAAFGWQSVPAEMHNYVVLDLPADCPYGISLFPIDNQPGNSTAQHPQLENKKDDSNRVTLYFAAENPEEVLKKVESAGGKKRFGPRPLAGYGTIWQFTDPDGNRFGIFKKK